jgi:hypothetical protein
VTEVKDNDSQHMGSLFQARVTLDGVPKIGFGIAKYIQ